LDFGIAWMVEISFFHCKGNLVQVLHVSESRGNKRERRHMPILLFEGSGR
jgi:hypothetical protein